MQAPTLNSPRRKPNYASPSHSPSLSLSGLERPVPRTSPLPQTSFQLPLTLPHTRSNDSPPSKLNKPLPETPESETPEIRPTSSIYSQIDETVLIIESYGRGNDERTASSTQAQTYTQRSYLPPQDSKGTAQEYLSSRSYSDRPAHWTQKSPLSSASASIHSSNIAPSQTSLPMQSARAIGPTPRHKANKSASHRSSRKKAPPLEPNIALSFGSIPYDSTFGHFPAPMSPRITDVIDHSLVPRPLDPRASRRMSAPQYWQPRSDSISKPTRQSKSKQAKSPSKKKEIGTPFLDLDDLDDQDEEIHSHFSRTSSSDSSWVLYPSFTDHLIAAVKDKIRPKSKKKRKQKERERATSHASAEYPQMNPYGRNSSSPEGPQSSPFRRESQTLQRGSQSLRMGSITLKNAIHDTARKFSTSSSRDANSRRNSMAKPSQPIRREKTLAIPTSPYQRYGPKIWEAPKKQKEPKPKKEKKLWRSSWRAQPKEEDRRAEAVRERRIYLPLLSQYHVDGRGVHGQKGKGKESEGKEERRMSSALQHGSKEILSAFERLTLKRSSMDEKRRAELKASIRLIGPSDQFADGRVNYWV